jgi:hypothetical protein
MIILQGWSYVHDAQHSEYLGAHMRNWQLGPAKKMSVTPVVGGWVRARKRDGVSFFPGYFFIVFLNSPRRETPKNVIEKNRGKLGKHRLWIFGRIICKNFSTRRFLQNENRFFDVFLNSHR